MMQSYSNRRLEVRPADTSYDVNHHNARRYFRMSMFKALQRRNDDVIIF